MTIVFVIFRFIIIPPGPLTPEVAIARGLLPYRLLDERLPLRVLDGHRPYDTMRAGSPGQDIARQPGSRTTTEAVRGDKIPRAALDQLEGRGDRSALIAALIARGDLDEARTELQNAGRGDNLDIERAVMARRDGKHALALSLLDGVLAHTPAHPQALWNRAVVLTDLGLPRMAAEAFDACARLAELGWSVEAIRRRDDLRWRADERAKHWPALRDASTKLKNEGTIPDLGLVRDHASVFRPALHGAARRAAARDDVWKLLPVAHAIDEASGDTASSTLIKRIASEDINVRGPAVALYRTFTTTRDLATADNEELLAQLRASRQDDLVVGALIRLPGRVHAAELVRLAHAIADPYLIELAAERDALAKSGAGNALEAEVTLREAVKHCAPRDVELRCADLQIKLARLYLDRHRPSDARETALRALTRSRSLRLYWDEHLLFDILADAARQERDYPQMRAYAREAALQAKGCVQQRMSQELIAAAELSELRFAGARAELDRTPVCDGAISLTRAQIEAELVHVDGTPERTARLHAVLDRMRRELGAKPEELAELDAIEGRLVAAGDRAAARPLLWRAIHAADALGIQSVSGTKARRHAYKSLLLLGATERGGADLLKLFADAVRAPLPRGCALGALIDGEQLLLLARDASGSFKQVFDAHAFKTPDFDASTLVPKDLVSALSRCDRVDVLALPPLFGEPRLLPPEIAWSYRGPAGAPPSGTSPRPTILTIEDVRPPAALGLPKLQNPAQRLPDPAVSNVRLSGPEATPERVRTAITLADLVEIHAHGFVDLGISDVSLIALSPEPDGTFALTARVIAGLKLARAPFVTLAACHAAFTAKYLHEPWSLPYAFLMAGARGVLAPATAIPDRDAGTFFRVVGDEILRGRDPAVVLRDQRRRWRSASAAWVNDVVLFD